MKHIRKVYLSGLGAIGGAYGSRIFDADPENISIIADKNRIDRYTENKITINGKEYPFKYVEPQHKGDTADLIIISVKNHHLQQALYDIENYVGDDTIIISLLNGIVSEEIIGNSYGHEKLIHSFVVGTDAVRNGTSISFSNIGKIIFGQKNKDMIEKADAVRFFFERTGIPYNIPEDIIRELWWKFMMNVGINQMSAILRANYGVFQQFSDARQLIENASNEVVSIAQKDGINLSKDDIAKYMKIIDTLSPEGKTSMLQDIEAGRKTEVDIFAGTVIELGRKYSVDTPVNDMLFRMIRTLEQMDQQKTR
jgi:2-dehydropantoate 2-reductase